MRKKYVQLNAALALDKETIIRLNEEQLQDLVGGQVTEGVITQSSCGAFSCNPVDCYGGPRGAETPNQPG